MKICILLLCFGITLGIRSECDPTQWLHPKDDGTTEEWQYKTSVTADPNAKLNVHLIPHSHDDPGWTKTVDQYYSGSRLDIGNQGVEYVLDSVVTELLKNPDRRFMFVEQSFFQRWWNDQTQMMKQTVKNLVKSKQLDLTVNGGWCMHDEATPHYTAMVDQTQLGHEFLKAEFNITPTIGWQIDPFGHSATQGSLLSAGVGFDGLYFARIDFQDYAKRIKNKDLEFIWRPEASGGKAKSEVFTGVIQDHYCAPKEFHFVDGGEPIVDDPTLFDYNVCSRVDEFISLSLKRGSHTKDGKHIFIPMGCDFTYQNAHIWFKNMDKLMHYVNQKDHLHGVHVLYSNLSYYTELKHAQNITWSVKTDDFFPYADSAPAYWTGYFTSRPTLKRFARVANGFLKSVRRLEATVLKTLNGSSSLLPLTKAVGLVQHHDGLSGTEKQEVAFDYSKRLAIGMAQAQSVVNHLLVVNHTDTFEFCWQRNASECASTSHLGTVKVSMYNPIPKERVSYVKIPVLTKNVQVTGVKLESPFAVLPSSANVALENPSKTLPYNLILPLKFPPLGFLHAFITVAKEEDKRERLRAPVAMERRKLTSSQYFVMENRQVRIEIDTKSASLASYTTRGGKNTVRLASSFEYYRSFQDSGSQRSGAYVFRPENSTTYPVTDATVTFTTTTREDGIQEVHFTVGKWLSVVYSLYPTDSFVRVEWTCGPVPIADGWGKEVIWRLSSPDVHSGNVSYTDSNGLAFIKRQRNYRPSWNVSLSEPVAGNYYPITTGAFIKDSDTQVTILTDRAQGMASLASGEMEVMIHRRLLFDDNRGVEEPLNETTSISPEGVRSGVGLVVRGCFRVAISTPSTAASVFRPEMERMLLPILPLFDSKNTSTETKLDITKSAFSVPENVHLQTFQLMNNRNSTFLVRIGHLFGPAEDELLSQPALVNLKQLFPSRKIISCTEMIVTGSATALERENGRLKWKTKDNVRASVNDSTASRKVDDVATHHLVSLSALEVKTFEIQVEI